ncbi:unnamed protein product [Tuber melanosporum]|uniref:(Perigord truffle) hypothetical protein n=1 Tax=Tuber melanosporum (strain Mel28) TaxID=656061 RepID=D5GH24_TUBMM|nr:uncharacterized protein GSTUM_00007668001 [Tuber melanosporum]CAZ83817.1 unnamed protein product [Tuber melanosporum]
MWPFPSPAPSSYVAQTQAQTHHLSTSQTRPNIHRTNSPDLFYPHSLSSPIEQHLTPSILSTSNMPRARRASRPAGPLIDLTDTVPISPSSNTQTERVFPAPKRRKTSESPIRFAKVEKVDLSLEADDEFSMKRNREELLKVQGGGDDGKRKKLAGFSCVICMEDEPTDLAATPCGHMFCHLCLHGAIKASTTTTHKSHGRCPVCRGKVSLKDVVTIEFKLLSKSQGKQPAK